MMRLTEKSAGPLEDPWVYGRVVHGPKDTVRDKAVDDRQSHSRLDDGHGAHDNARVVTAGNAQVGLATIHDVDR